MKLSGLYVWKSVCGLDYPCLESYLSSWEMTDEQILCVDPASDDETLKLAHALEDKFPTTRIVWFRWPDNAPGDGSKIGIASQFALQQATGNYCLNVQADEIYPTMLSTYIKDNKQELMRSGIDGFNLKVLHLHHNASEFQGGEQWDGRKDTEMWHRGGMMNADRTRGGAGYNKSIKLFRKCPAITFKHDGWSMSGCATVAMLDISQSYPVIHMHDHFRDSLISLRKSAAETIWTDRVKFGDYKASADRLESTQDKWWDDPRWAQKVSPFDEFLPDYVKPLIGNTSYRVRWELL